MVTGERSQLATRETPPLPAAFRSAMPPTLPWMIHYIMWVISYLCLSSFGSCRAEAMPKAGGKREEKAAVDAMMEKIDQVGVGFDCAEVCHIYPITHALLCTFTLVCVCVCMCLCICVSVIV